MSGPQSSLARFAALGHEPDDTYARAAARKAFHDHDVICINPSWITSWGDRQLVIAIAERIHGKRKGGRS